MWKAETGKRTKATSARTEERRIWREVVLGAPAPAPALFCLLQL